MYRITLLALSTVAVWAFLGCQTAPDTPEGRAALEDEAEATVRRMTDRDSTLQKVLDDSHGYVVLPSVGEAGAIAGAAYGRGIAYERGMPVGYVDLNQASVGLQLGGQTFSELIVFNSEAAFTRLESGTFSIGTDATATAIGAGVAREAQFRDGLAVFIEPRGGAMAGVSVSGQQIDFVPNAKTADEHLGK